MLYPTPIAKLIDSFSKLPGIGAKTATRPAFWYMDDEIMVLASERPVIQTALNVSAGSINELQPGQAILISKTGKMRLAQINRAKEKKACSDRKSVV
mgnify:CR=1 FL=1